MKRVLMINPPALVTSIWQLIQYPEPYPYGLLKLGSMLSGQGVACELIDMMEYGHHTDEFMSDFPENLIRHSEKATGSVDVRRSVYYLGQTPDWLEQQLATRQPPDEVWVSCCLSFNFEPAHEVIGRVKKVWPKTPVKLGGIYPTLAPEHAARSGADEVVSGKIEPAEGLPGDYSLYAEPPPVGIFNFATGCPNKCSFCVNHHQQPKLRVGADQVLAYLAELNAKYGIRHFSNWDPNVMIYRDELVRLLSLIADSDLGCSLSFDMGIQCNRLTLEVARKMKKAGVTQVTVPFETTDPEMLKRFRKPYRSQAPIKAILNLKKAGFDLTKLHSCSLFGFEDEDPRHLYRTWLSIIGLGVRPIFSPYAPVPTSAEWKRVGHLIEDKPLDELNGYLFPLMDSAEKVHLYEKLIELFHTWDLRTARKLMGRLPPDHQRLFEEELDFVTGELGALGHEFHVPKKEITESWRVETPRKTRDTTDLVLVIPPVNDEQIMPELGPAQLESYLENRGISVRQLDMNQVFLDRYFTRQFYSYKPKPEIRHHLVNTPKEYEQLTELATRSHPVYDPFFKGVLFQHWKSPPPRALGISILSAGQLLPSLRLGALVKKHWGDVPILWGGPYAAPAKDIFKKFLADDRLALDGFAVFGGERALEEVLQGTGFANAPGLVSMGPHGIVEGPKAKIIPLRELPTPRFDALPYQLYLAPLLPVPTALGCFHSECKFCHHRIQRPSFDPLGGQFVAQEMIKLADRYKMNSFFMADHATRAQTLQEVAEELIRQKQSLKFSAMARAETEFSQECLDTIARGGGRMLFVGLESTNQEFLELMNKGITVEQVETLCHRAKKAGLYVVLFILDLPSRPAQEVLDTIQWCMDRADIVHDLVYQRFVLSRDVLYFTNPKELGIEPTVDPATWTDVYDIPYRSLNPRTDEETAVIDAKRLEASALFLKKRKIAPTQGGDIWVECHTL